jgi:acyl-CoA thioesterase-1
MRFKAAITYFVVMAFGLSTFGNSIQAKDGTLQLVGFGDSLMAGYQLPQDDALPAQMQKALTAKGIDTVIVNAGVSGDTSAAGLARVDWSVPDGTDGVILELGANDALRGIAPEETEKNLEAIIGRLRDRGIEVLLIRMIAPPKMGGDYRDRFNPIYQRLADKYDLVFYPFVLDGVVTEPDLKIEDGMHPNAKGVAVMVERMLPAVERFIGSISSNPN